MMTSIIKRQREPHADFNRFVLGMFLLYATRPRDAEPDETGAYFIGECSNVPQKNWTRPLGPYSPAQRIGDGTP